MNRNSYFFFAFFSFLFIWACSEPQAPGGAGTAAVASKAGGSPVDTNLRISVDSARNQTQRWIQISNGLKTPTNPYDYLLIQGFQIPVKEFQTMLAALGSEPQVWGKLAIQYDDKTKKPYLGLIFQGKPAGDTTTQFANFKFYDFSMPCPDYCPDRK